MWNEENSNWKSPSFPRGISEPEEWKVSVKYIHKDFLKSFWFLRQPWIFFTAIKRQQYKLVLLAAVQIVTWHLLLGRSIVAQWVFPMIPRSSKFLWNWNTFCFVQNVVKMSENFIQNTWSTVCRSTSTGTFPFSLLASAVVKLFLCDGQGLEPITAVLQSSGRGLVTTAVMNVQQETFWVHWGGLIEGPIRFQFLSSGLAVVVWQGGAVHVLSADEPPVHETPKVWLWVWLSLIGLIKKDRVMYDDVAAALSFLKNSLCFFFFFYSHKERVTVPTVWGRSPAGPEAFWLVRCKSPSRISSASPVLLYWTVRQNTTVIGQ